MSDTTDSGHSDGLSHGRHSNLNDIDTIHTITLSTLDQGMPRHYTRFCLAFSLGDTSAFEAISRLRAFFQRTFQVHPWLAGYACPVKGDSLPGHQLEIRYSRRDVENFEIKIRDQTETFSLSYRELCDLGMPPSKIPRELVSSCPDRRPDTEPGLILDVTVNIIRGGLLVALFLHHGVTDGATMGTIIGGELCSHIKHTVALSPEGLAQAAHDEMSTREPLSRVTANQAIGQHFEYRPALRALNMTPPPPLGPSPTAEQVASHIFFFPDSKLRLLKTTLNALVHASTTPEIPWVTTHDALQSLLWQHLTRARAPSLKSSRTTLPQKSTLLIPVNIRKRIKPPLPPHYMGGAVALAPASVTVDSLLGPPASSHDLEEPAQQLISTAYLLNTCIVIHTAISRCEDTYLREVLALTNQQDSCRNMVDLNLDTLSGLDLCITSWAVLPIFGPIPGRENCSGDMGMGLGLPDFIRKPWSRDAGGCIILPKDPRRRDAGVGDGQGESGLEVLVQLKTEDMQRLVEDRDFMAHVGRVID